MIVVRRSRTWGARVFAAALFLMCGSARAFAADHYAIVITGAAGASEYALKYRSWRTSLTGLLQGRFGYPDDHIIVLADEADRNVRRPTREIVRAAFADLQRRTHPDDVVFVLLMGHGSSGNGAHTPDEGDAKFNLVGPDMSAGEWADVIKPIPARIVFVNGASGSFPFLRKLAGRGRIVVTATAAITQEYETIFPEFLVKAFGDPSADADKDGRVSIWEAFSYASAAVRRWFDQLGQLPTERALLDDTGDGVGREADDPKGTDGAVAKVTYLQLDAPIAVPVDGELGALLRRRADTQGQVDLLRARKPNLPEAEYQAQLERLLLELARLDRDIRAKQ